MYLGQNIAVVVAAQLAARALARTALRALTYDLTDLRITFQTAAELAQLEALGIISPDHRARSEAWNRIRRAWGRGHTILLQTCHDPVCGQRPTKEGA